jgi:hypothetical protein
MHAAWEKPMQRSLSAGTPARWQGVLNWLALLALVALCLV